MNGNKLKFNIGDLVICTNTNNVGGVMWRNGIVIGYNHRLNKYTVAIPYQTNIHDEITKRGFNLGYFAETWREDCLQKVD